MTPYSHYSNEELIELTYRSSSATSLELEFAFRLENDFAGDLKVAENLTQAALPFKESKFG